MTGNASRLVVSPRAKAATTKPREARLHSYRVRAKDDPWFWIQILSKIRMPNAMSSWAAREAVRATKTKTSGCQRLLANFIF